MVIRVYNLRKPGMIYDSSKLAILGRMIKNGIQADTKGRYVVRARPKAKTRTLLLTVYKANPETGRLSKASRGEQGGLAGRISTFLNSNGVSHDINVI